MKVFALVLARDKNHVSEKKRELDGLGLKYRIVCGEDIEDPDVVYRAPKGKFDAINYGMKFVPADTDIVLMNDVDTTIVNLAPALRSFDDEEVGLVFARVNVGTGPQTSFYKILDGIRSRVPITSSGELILVRKDILDDILPMKPCKAEDSYIMFKVLEFKRRVVFSRSTYVNTVRTKVPEEEEKYKRRTVGGLYQALSLSKPPLIIRGFYVLLPFASPLLLVLGDKGYFWMKGILLGFVDYLRGDATGSWGKTY